MADVASGAGSSTPAGGALPIPGGGSAPAVGLRGTRDFHQFPRAIFLTLAPSVAIVLVAAFARDTWFWVGYVGAVGVLLGAVVALRRDPILVSAMFLVWLSLQRFAIAGLSPGLTADQLKAALAYKELFFPVLGLIALPALVTVLREGRGVVRAVDGLAIAFGILIVLALVVSPAPLGDRLLYARRLAVLPLVYIVARLLPWRAPQLRAAVALVVIAGIALTAFGLVERYLAEGYVWRELVPAAYYYHLSGLADLNTPGTDFPVAGLPRVFYDYSAGIPVRRLVSTFLEATTLASFLAAATVLSIVRARVRPSALAAAGVIGVGAYLTLSKAGLAIVAIAFLYVVATEVIPRLRDPAWIWSMGAGLVGALLVIALALETSGSTAGALAHLDGLKEGIASAARSPLGIGLGVAGGFGFGSTLGAESTFGILLVQLGIPGLVIWGAWLLGLTFVCASMRDRIPGSPRLAAGVTGLLIGFFVTASLTESAGGLLGNWIFAFVAGAVVAVGARDGRVMRV